MPDGRKRRQKKEYPLDTTDEESQSVKWQPHEVKEFEAAQMAQAEKVREILHQRWFGEDGYAAGVEFLDHDVVAR